MSKGRDDDEWRWLEDLDTARALDWVTERNAETVTAFAGDGAFTRLTTALRQVLDAEDRIPYPGWRGDGLYYNYWRDAAHPRGMWRRTTLEQYRRREPEWDVLLDLDKLAASEGENWVWGGVTVRRPDHERCLVSLSRGGADATVVREFDLRHRAFVQDGFTLPEAKSDVSWIDADHIFVATDEGPGSLTSSGYPRVARRWRRGTPLTATEPVFQADVDDIGVYAYHDPARDYPRDFVGRNLDFFRSEDFLRTAAGELIRIPVPPDASWSVHREWLIIRPRADWVVAGTRFPAGALLAARFDAFLAGGRDLIVLFAPDGRTSLMSSSWTRNHLILGLLTDVRSRLEALTPGPARWQREALGDGSGFDSYRIVDTDPDRNDAYLVSSAGFLRPPTLQLGSIGGRPETLKQSPSYFDTAGLSVRQFFATSDDGTRVPYFVVGDLAAGDSAPGPVILTGYGGFELSRTPSYDGIIGRGWLERGGVYVVANIRGGGEYGPTWHRAAIRERRPRAYEDFAAVARDLVARGITTPGRLGIEGGSNGGLLMGVMLTRFPTLFGAVVAHVPLLDMRRYHLLHAGASWMAEYGDPDQEADWAYLREFSPYHNVQPGQPYPPVLLITSTRDDRVHPGHARKMAARLRAHGYDVSYFENVEGGHGAAADNEQAAFIAALSLEFLRRQLALRPHPRPRPMDAAVTGPANAAVANPANRAVDSAA